jgi:O-methyltransferase
MSELPDAYIDLVKKSVSGAIYGTQIVHIPVSHERRNRAIRTALRVLARTGLQVTRPTTLPREVYEEGRGWPAGFPVPGESMLGRKRLDNVHECVDDVLRNDVPGDLIETGVWRGGTTILMRAILKARGVTDRTVYVADSFAGLPPPDAEKYPADEGVDLSGIESLAVSIEQVRSNFARYGLLDEQVRFLEGWFRDTLPTVRDNTWALMRLDGDLYESTMDALTNLYPGLSPGGYCIIDDYGAYKPCRQAVHDYRSEHGIDEPLKQVDWTGAYWQRASA